MLELLVELLLDLGELLGREGVEVDCGGGCQRGNLGGGLEASIEEEGFALVSCWPDMMAVVMIVCDVGDKDWSSECSSTPLEVGDNLRWGVDHLLVSPYRGGISCPRCPK